MSDCAFLETANKLSVTLAPVKKAQAIMVGPDRQAWRFTFDRHDLLDLQVMQRWRSFGQDPHLLFDRYLFERVTTEHDVMADTVSIFALQTAPERG